ncbi:DNA primase large subunit-like isoform X2 [Chelonus insularis]|uniref:DNA primase large subunit-like isoform X2 n=1 Tax=Chelonus insularis TaxID=460826 RepID=UPI00158D29F1|nr:DNA primase large subunit-like isoform X2 [Chelonus insularis]
MSKKMKLHIFYPMDLQFYENVPPPITAEQLLKITIERIYVLKIISSVERGVGFKNREEKNIAIMERLKKIGSDRYARLISSTGCRMYSEETLEDRVIDHTSFVALSLALITDTQLYEVFQRLEKQLFKIRVSNLDEKAIYKLLNLYNKFPQVNNNEKQELQHQLINFIDNPKDLQGTQFFKVPISLLLGVINFHEVYFDKGIAYIPFDQIRAVFEGLFRENLEQQVYSVNMERLNYCFEIFEQSKKFSEILKEIGDKFIEVQQYSAIGEKIVASDVDELAVSSFPPCMRVIHEVLRSQHHLKHESRLQYTLFLKGAGLPVDEAIKLFSEEFLKKISEKRFNREYKYYIEHAYGFRGNKTDYHPLDCCEIQKNPTAFGDCNGCLFLSKSTTDIEDLDVKLSQWKISDNHRREIIERTKKGNCSSACAYYFKITNNCSLNKPVKHPNEFFFDSRHVRANHFTQNNDKDYQDLNIENCQNVRSINILADQEFNQSVQRTKSKVVIEVNKTTPIFSNNKNEVVHASTKGGISKVSITNSSIDKTISKFNGAKSVASSANMINHPSKGPETLVQNHQTLPRHYFKAIRPSMATFDELIGIKNIQSGSIITYAPKSLDKFDTNDEISSNNSPVRKRKRNA